MPKFNVVLSKVKAIEAVDAKEALEKMMVEMKDENFWSDWHIATELEMDAEGESALPYKSFMVTGCEAKGDINA